MSRRRRRGRKARRVSLGAAAAVAAAVAVVLVLVIGSLSEVHAQSTPYRQSTTRGYVALITPVIVASNQTGSRLASLIASAPSMKVGGYPGTGRAVLQQGLDRAVADAEDDVTQAGQLVPPAPSGSLGAEVDAVLESRAAAVTELRTAIDGLLDMAPLPVAGAPTTTSSSTVPALSVAQARQVLGAQGAALAAADRRYAGLASDLRSGKGPDGVQARLPRSTWVPARHPVLGSSQLVATAAALDANEGLAPIHLVRVIAVGLSPAAVPVSGGGSGVIGVTCNQPQPSALGGSGSPSDGPAVLPPTGTIGAHVTVTNCGTTNEADVTVTATLELDDPPGHAPPRAAARGSSATLHVASMQAGASTALAFPPLAVGGGHTYLLHISAKVPEGQAFSSGTIQTLSLQISA